MTKEQQRCLLQRPCALEFLYFVPENNPLHRATLNRAVFSSPAECALFSKRTLVLFFHDHPLHCLEVHIDKVYC
jgi:hypothetical protein